MGQEAADSGSPEVIVLPAIPWLRDGTDYDIYLESAIAHLKAQEIPPGVEVLPLFMTSTVDDDVEIPKKFNYSVLVPKLNEIVAAFRASPATHLLITDADGEMPPHALKTLLAHDVDVASGISPPHKTWTYTTAFRYVPPPTPVLLKSEPYFKPYKMNELRNIVIGPNELVATGHFCLLVKKHVFDAFRFRWPGLKTSKSRSMKCPACDEAFNTVIDCPKSKLGAEFLFWMDVQMLGYSAVIDGNILCGHRPQWPLSELVE